jgi:hypothetical protein
VTSSKPAGHDLHLPLMPAELYIKLKNNILIFVKKNIDILRHGQEKLLCYIVTHSMSKICSTSSKSQTCRSSNAPAATKADADASAAVANVQQQCTSYTSKNWICPADLLTNQTV